VNRRSSVSLNLNESYHIQQKPEHEDEEKKKKKNLSLEKKKKNLTSTIWFRASLHETKAVLDELLSWLSDELSDFHL